MSKAIYAIPCNYWRDDDPPVRLKADRIWYRGLAIARELDDLDAVLYVIGESGEKLEARRCAISFNPYYGIARSQMQPAVAPSTGGDKG